MTVVQIGLTDRTGNLDKGMVQSVAAALNIQVMRDVAPFWNTQATVLYLPNPRHIPPGVWPAFLVDHLPPGEGGFHLDKNRQPYAKIVASPDSDGWTVAASHEVVEMLVDPQGSRLQTSRSIQIGNDGAIHDGPGEFQYLVEACDPCESDDHAYLIQGVAVSDFLTPNFYDPVVSPGTRYSFTGAITAPRQVLPGGYISWVDPETEDWQQLRWIDPNQGPSIVDLGPAQGASLRRCSDDMMGATGVRTGQLIAEKPLNEELFAVGARRREMIDVAAAGRGGDYFS